MGGLELLLTMNDDAIVLLPLQSYLGLKNSKPNFKIKRDNLKENMCQGKVITTRENDIY